MAKALTGAQKAAVFLLSLGEEQAIDVMRSFSSREIKILANSIRDLGTMEPQLVDAVHQQFLENARQGGMTLANRAAFVRVANQALGEKAADVLAYLESDESGALSAVDEIDDRTLANLLHKEHPQTIALVLSTLPTPQAGQILAALPEDARTTVAYRMATIERPSPEVIAEIQAVLGDFVQTEVPDLGAKFGGTSHLASSLNEIDQGVWRGILDGIEDLDAAVAQDIKNQMFTFSDLVLLDNKSIQAVMKEVDSKDLALSLKGATQEVRELVFGNMSKRATTAIREEMDYMGPVRVSEVEVGQGRIIDVVRRLEAEGAIYIAGRGGKEGGIIE